MSKILMVFGAEGTLGKGATAALLGKPYDKFYLVNRQFNFFKNSEFIQLITLDDVTIEENVRAVFKQIDVNKEDELFLFSTIGGFAGGIDIEETEYSVWKKMLDLNLNSSFLIAKHFIPKVKKAKGGAIVFTSALAASKPGKSNSAYSVSKNALNFFVKSLALEGKKYNLSANAISPLVIDSPENREWVKDENILVTPERLGETVNMLFAGYTTLTGNIVEIPGTIDAG